MQDHDSNRERLELALEAAGLDLWENDLQTGVVTEKVSKILRELGYDDTQASDSTTELFTLTHPDDAERIKSAISDHIAGRTPQYRCEFRMRSKSGEWLWFANYGKVMDRDRQNPGRRFIGVTFNINDRKTKEDEIERINRELQEQIAERHAREAALREANLRAEAASLAKSHFLANMSHEIRTPMNAIIGLSNLALKTELSAQQRDYMAKVHHAGTSLLGLINDILDLSKIEAGKLEIQNAEFLLDRTLDTVAAVVSHKAADKGLELVFDIPVDIPQSLTGDALRIEQILTNLIGNAVKFTDCGEVVVRVEWLDNTEHQVKLKFSVRDTGIGMTLPQQQRLFQAFTQADGSITRKYGGTGLGLTICKRLVELMGGTIWVESAPGAGSTFCFTVWFGRGRDLNRRELPARIDGLRVLVVDDNPDARRVLAGHCATLPLRVDQAASGQEALAAVREAKRANCPYGLVLMDWVMPNMNGIDTARAIRADAALQPAPAIVLVSAFGRDYAGDEAGGFPLDGVLPKPVSASTLVDMLVELYGADAKHAPSAVIHHYRLEGVRVLLVEDNAINQQIASELMAAAGVVVDVAGNGRIALDKLASGARYDIVLMDLQMPEMDGYAATEAIRADASLAALPIVAMTAHAMSEERARCMALGMNDHIAKPIDPDLLFATLARWSGRNAKNDAGAASRDRPGASKPNPAGSCARIDVAATLHRLGGNATLFHKLLAQFLHEHAGVAAQITRALADGDRPGAMRGAHTMKGVAANLGAESLAAAAAELEEAIHQGNENAALSVRFSEVCDATMAAIRQIVPNGAAPHTTGSSGGQTASTDTLQLLADYLCRGNPDAVHFFAAHRDALARFLGESAERVEHAVGIFDFESALDLLCDTARARNVELDR